MLERGHTARTTAAACGVSERSYREYCTKYPAFSAAAQRARARGRARIVESILDSGDWKGLSWYLSVTDPEQFARTAERQIVVQPPPVREDGANFGEAVVALRELLTEVRDEAKKAAIQATLATVEEEYAKVTRLFDDLRSQRLL